MAGWSIATAYDTRASRRLKPVKTQRVRVHAKRLAKGQRDIAVSEFFVRNLHLLGFDSPARAVLTAVREAVDNALDACEEAGILPDIGVDVQRADDHLKIIVQDNGPGIMEAQIAKIFAKLLYGSKFHEVRQSRGQQGIGISAAGMYGQLTTGRPMRVVSRTGPTAPAWEFLLSIDTRKNRPNVHKRKRADWTVPHGTLVEFELEGLYQRGHHSVEAYLRQTAMVNPHVRIQLEDPEGSRLVLERLARRLPKRPALAKPHPHGIELGRLMEMLRTTRHRALRAFLSDEFARVGETTAKVIIKAARHGVVESSRPSELDPSQVKALHRALADAAVSAPSAASIVLIGKTQMLAGLRRAVPGEFYCAGRRSPGVYRGNPFVVEVALVYQGRRDSNAEDVDLVPKADESIRLLRFANRVPLMFQQGACAITAAVTGVDWKAYGLDQTRGGLPRGPVVLVVHLASTWVPFTSESKEAIAAYPEILHEIRLGLQECGRELGTHLKRQQRQAEAAARVAQIRKYAPHIAIALRGLLDLDPKQEREIQLALERLLDPAKEDVDDQTNDDG